MRGPSDAMEVPELPPPWLLAAALVPPSPSAASSAASPEPVTGGGLAAAAARLEARHSALDGRLGGSLDALRDLGEDARVVAARLAVLPAPFAGARRPGPLARIANSIEALTEQLTEDISDCNRLQAAQAVAALASLHGERRAPVQSSGCALGTQGFAGVGSTSSYGPGSNLGSSGGGGASGGGGGGSGGGGGRRRSSRGSSSGAVASGLGSMRWQRGAETGRVAGLR
mmetsp:Transcript_52555/g.141515  ORF Transcript_52555/g.141515 Transcript_52555/m.141515 type:complete len:228 (+) Transcript_52555:47-730(+)